MGSLPIRCQSAATGNSRFRSSSGGEIHFVSGLGFESGGLAAAHAIHNGLTAATGKFHQLSHGEKIAYTTLMQLLLEQDTNELERYIVLYQALGLPTTLAEMQMDSLNDQELLAIGIQATLPNETIHRMPFKITAEEVANAFQAVDAYVTKNFSQRKKIDFYFFPC